MENKDNMNVVIVGHVDHGKSTIIGRLLHDTGSIPDGKLEQVKQNCKTNSRPFRFAYLIDALKDEQSRGITIDSARVFFKTKKRDYIIIDSPGHIEFLKNMITGASRAEAALLVVDASEGVHENSRRHGYMASMLGISQAVVLVNKMDLVDYSEDVFNSIVKDYSLFLKEINISPQSFIPVSGIEGDNITEKINAMTWYKGRSLLETLDSFRSAKAIEEREFRMPVQDVYDFSKSGDDRIIIAGTISSGSISEGDEVTFYPSLEKGKVKSIERFNSSPVSTISAPNAVGFTIDKSLSIKRGELAVKSSERKPEAASIIRTRLFWLGERPMEKDKEYILKIGSSRAQMKLEEVHKVIDSHDLHVDADKEIVERHEVAECTLRLLKEIAFDTADVNRLTSRFVVVEDYDITGGGKVLKCC